MGETADGVLLVTGGGTGIGRETVKQALTAGYRVVAFGRDGDRLMNLQRECSAGVRLLVRSVDVSDWEATQRAVTETVKAVGRLDGVVANAGVFSAHNFESSDPADWAAMVSTNILGVAHIVKASLSEIRHTRGRYVLVSSVLARVPLSGSFYGATKQAVAGLAENLRLELIGSGVGVTEIAPGTVDTPLWEQKPKLSLRAADVAEAILWAAGRPAGVTVNEMVIRPTDQAV